ncbi:uncharacterized protein KQ657_001670 [Scheffersomyces spartinae]|uniref:Uncharacterized protein n=1 Tax=Scheffersomyces spartinae TaxID=45513 RepID=A0A9P7V7C6_9ASCO|nr:uncharacterized protein KQ657_001670 [Scheffersomyces spartinae]KAG7192570.1 hypothetical protein KQ657_001670 [Scheffersomyces spartinae]
MAETLDASTLDSHSATANSSTDPLFMLSSKPLKAKTKKKAVISDEQVNVDNTASANASLIEVIDDSEDDEIYGSASVEQSILIQTSPTKNFTELNYDQQHIEDANDVYHDSDYIDVSENVGPHLTASGPAKTVLKPETRVSESLTLADTNRLETRPQGELIYEQDHENSTPVKESNLEEVQPQRFVTLSIKSAQNTDTKSISKPLRLKGKPLTLLLTSNGGIKRRVGLSKRSNIDSLHQYLDKR